VTERIAKFRRVVRCIPRLDRTIAERFDLVLECGHVVVRPLVRMRLRDGLHALPEPTKCLCDECWRLAMLSA
jgi:hypothetical protein